VHVPAGRGAPPDAGTPGPLPRVGVAATLPYPNSEAHSAVSHRCASQGAWHDAGALGRPLWFHPQAVGEMRRGVACQAPGGPRGDRCFQPEQAGGRGLAATGASRRAGAGAARGERRRPAADAHPLDAAGAPPARVPPPDVWHAALRTAAGALRPRRAAAAAKLRPLLGCCTMAAHFGAPSCGHANAVRALCRGWRSWRGSRACARCLRGSA